jgi:hypothetical protein
VLESVGSKLFSSEEIFQHQVEPEATKDLEEDSHRQRRKSLSFDVTKEIGNKIIKNRKV